MPTNPYTSVSISGYNSSPPPDDGTTGSNNTVEWDKHKTKLADPVKTLAESMDTNVLAAFGKTVNTDSGEDNPIAGGIAYTPATFTIASGAITPTRANVVLAAESGTADTLDTMATGSLSDGAIVILSVDTGDTITINDAQGSAGQIHLVDSQDLALTGNDRLTVMRDGTDWYELSRSVDNQQIVQVIHTSDSASSTGTTAFANDDTTPQNTEGNAYTALDTAITPKDTANRLLIEVVVYGACDATENLAIALFQDSTADALASGMGNGSGGANDPSGLVLRYEMAAGTTSSTTFKVRAGATGAGTFTFNGIAGSAKFNGTLASHMRITEYRS